MKNKFMLAWQKFNKLKSAKNKLSNKEVEYVTDPTRKEIQVLRYKRIMEALVFWEFLRNQLTLISESEKYKEDVKIFREFLGEFFVHPNLYMGIVASFEYLPTSVLRKCLWKYNIDFKSFESILRRIKDEQMIALMDNVTDLMTGTTPRVFSSNKKVSANDLLQEEVDLRDRYLTKGSMSYNLLGLDFGFNAYPKGVKDDTHVVEISPFRFLSKKEHADDFVVNTENGKYWWLYKKARSNSAYWPKRHVELNSHICPGFWYTLFVHVLFWIISPICFVSTVSALTQGEVGLVVFIVQALIGLIFPVWCVAAGVKYFKDFVSHQIKRIYKKERKKLILAFVNSFEKTAAFIVLFMVFTLLAKLFYLIGFSHGIRLLLLCVSLSSWLYMAAKKPKRIPYYRKVFLVFSICIGISYGVQYHNEVFAALSLVWGWIELLGKWLISTALPWLLSSLVVILEIVFDSLVLFFGTLGIFSLLLLIMLLVPVLLFVIVRFQANKQDEQSPFVNKIHEFVSKALPKVKYLIIPFAFGILYLTPRDLLVLYAIAIGVLLVIFFLASKYLWNNHIKYDKRIKDIVLFLMKYFNLSKYDATGISYAFVNNRWLSQFKKIEEKEKVLDEIEIFTKRIFPRSIGEKREMQHYFFMLNLVAEVNKRAYSVITGINKAGVTYKWKKFDKNKLTYSDVEEVVRIILKTKNFKDLFNNISIMEKAKYQKNFEDDVKVKQFFETVATPFRKVRDFFAAIYGLLQLFNKRCPYIDKQKVIL